MTEEDIDRLRRLLHGAETGQVACFAIAYVTDGAHTCQPDGVRWEHSRTGKLVHGAALIGAVEAVKVDLVKHVLPCNTCEAPTLAPLPAVASVVGQQLNIETGDTVGFTAGRGGVGE